MGNGFWLYYSWPLSSLVRKISWENEFQGKPTCCRSATLLNGNSDMIAFAIRKTFQNLLFKEYLWVAPLNLAFKFLPLIQANFWWCIQKLKVYIVKMCLSLQPFQDLSSSAHWKRIQRVSLNFRKCLIMIKIP